MSPSSAFPAIRPRLIIHVTQGYECCYCWFNQKDKPTSNTTVKLSLLCYVSSAGPAAAHQPEPSRRVSRKAWQWQTENSRTGDGNSSSRRNRNEYHGAAAVPVTDSMNDSAVVVAETKTGKAQRIQIRNWFMPVPTVLLMNLNEYHLQMNHCVVVQ